MAHFAFTVLDGRQNGRTDGRKEGRKEVRKDSDDSTATARREVIEGMYLEDWCKGITVMQLYNPFPIRLV
jgi:hypothetical protein